MPAPFFLSRCRLQKSAVLAFFLALGVCASADPIKLRILYNGNLAGSNTYDTQADGSFSSVTDFKLGSIDLSSTLGGRIVSGKLSQYDFAGSQGTATKISLKLRNGQIAIAAGGKSANVPFTDKTGILFGALHPQFASLALLLAEKALRNNPGVPQTKISAFLLEGAAVVPMDVSPLPSRKVTVDGHEQNARRFSVGLGAVTIEFDLNDANHVVAMDIPTQKIRFLAEGWDALFVDPLAKYPELSQATFKVKTDIGLRMKTRDGVELVCDVIRPDDDQKHPAILSRTPYGRGGSAIEGPFWAARGYCFVSQDCRGREDSGGDWDPFVNEGPDGYDSIQWLASQPWCDGNVGMIGGSYGGYVQWAAATLNPPALKCIVPQVSPPDAMHNLPYEFGTFALYADLWWSKIVAGKKTNLGGATQLLEHPEKLTMLPLERVDQAVLGQHLKFFSSWLGRDTMAQWKGYDFTNYIGNSHVPALHISGTWDGDGIGTLMNWDAMRKLGRTDQWIIFGPWIHAFNTTHSFGGEEYGPDAILELDSVYLRWFDTWLKGKKVGQESVPHVKLFVTGANKWVEASQWPSIEMPARTLYFGKRSLSTKPASFQVEERVYDPAKDTKIPIELKTGAIGVGHTKLTAQALHDPRACYFYSQPFAKATAVTGPVIIKIHFTCSAVNTDFYASVFDMAPDGSARTLGIAGKLRTAYLNGTDKRRPLKPGKEYIATLMPWQFAHEFAKGHKMGLIIVNSEFPMFARNLGTMDPIKTATRMVVQRDRILMGKGHESSVTFHVIWER